jgi:hypothetical protein
MRRRAITCRSRHMRAAAPDVYSVGIDVALYALTR